MVLDRRMHYITTISSMIFLLLFHMGFIVYLAMMINDDPLVACALHPSPFRIQPHKCPYLKSSAMDQSFWFTVNPFLFA